MTFAITCLTNDGILLQAGIGIKHRNYLFRAVYHGGRPPPHDVPTWRLINSYNMFDNGSPQKNRELFETSASAHDMFPNPLSTDNHVTIHCSMFTFIDTVVITYTRINCWCHQVTGDMAPFVRFLCRRPSLSGIVPVLSCKKKNTCKTLMCHCQGCS